MKFSFEKNLILISRVRPVQIMIINVYFRGKIIDFFMRDPLSSRHFVLNESLVTKLCISLNRHATRVLLPGFVILVNYDLIQ